MVPVTVSLIPTPFANDLYEQNVQYLVVDPDGVYHIAKWDGEHMYIPDMSGAAAPEEGEPEVDPTAVNTDPVPVEGGKLPDPAPQAVFAGDGMEAARDETEDQADSGMEDAAEEEDDDSGVYIEYIARLPEFVAPHYL